MSRYDSRTTIFSPEGRLYQIEYAMEAINQVGMGFGITTPEGVLLVSEKRLQSKLLDLEGSEKLYKIDGHVYCIVAGITADANTLVNEARLHAQQFRFKYSTPVPMENLVQHIADIKQSYTQFGGLRPYGVSMIFAGYEESLGWRLYQSDPSGNYGGWKAVAIGQNASTTNSIFRTDWTEDLDWEKATTLALKVVQKSLDTASLSPAKIELAMLKLVDGEPKLELVGDEALGEACEAYKVAAKENPDKE
ncbi:Proteasome, subunit alpha/beta [Carpediemonas membranifera]|uniref:Proteasome subunit alpha type n=1 Tax=Carpediemonas membranifera TaxID=201153 RepID=A0A8J6BYP8_9EUKA|nr:Proteasome, subunit alpha/beta [Carpediemonas membranifera]|eukprot:KAG9394731.1 Proteasome, subunit alpha/beta [Carpediemonas membranifera]